MSYRLKPIMPGAVLWKVSSHYGISTEEMRTKKYSRQTTEARGVAMYLARNLCNSKFVEIGRYFGVDHSRVLHDCGKVDQRIKSDDEFRLRVEKIEEAIRKVAAL